jgi:hypothetical protein
VICLCGHEKARHRGPGSCRDCGQFGCDAYEPADAVSDAQAIVAQAIVDEVTVPPVATGIVSAAPVGESTSAALARVTQERDYLLGVVEGQRRTIAELTDERDGLKTALTLTNTSREFNRSLSSELKARVADLAAERDEARTQLDRADRALKARDHGADVIATNDAWACLDEDGCGRRYGYPDPETHELTCGRRLMPIRVAITRRSAG